MKKIIIFLFLTLYFKPVFAVPDSFADLVEKLSPSVVSIASTTIFENNSQNQIPQFPEGSPFDEFFKDYFDRDYNTYSLKGFDDAIDRARNECIRIINERKN